MSMRPEFVWVENILRYKEGFKFKSKKLQRYYEYVLEQYKKEKEKGHK